MHECTLVLLGKPGIAGLQLPHLSGGNQVRPIQLSQVDKCARDYYGLYHYQVTVCGLRKIPKPVSEARASWLLLLEGQCADRILADVTLEEKGGTVVHEDGCTLSEGCVSRTLSVLVGWRQNGCKIWVRLSGQECSTAASHVSSGVMK